MNTRVLFSRELNFSARFPHNNVSSLHLFPPPRDEGEKRCDCRHCKIQAKPKMFDVSVNWNYVCELVRVRFTMKTNDFFIKIVFQLQRILRWCQWQWQWQLKCDIGFNETTNFRDVFFLRRMSERKFQQASTNCTKQTG